MALPVPRESRPGASARSTPRPPRTAEDGLKEKPAPLVPAARFIQFPAMKESWSTRLARIAFNWFPAYRGTGGRVTYIAADWSEVRVRVALSWRTRNYVGTIFGGSLYGAVDPIYMIMLIKRLGPGYVVWDKAAAVRFRRPGRGVVSARFLLDDATVQGIRDELAASPKTERVFDVALTLEDGSVCAEVEKTLHVSLAERGAGLR